MRVFRGVPPVSQENSFLLFFFFFLKNALARGRLSKSRKGPNRPPFPSSPPPPNSDSLHFFFSIRVRTISPSKLVAPCLGRSVLFPSSPPPGSECSCHSSSGLRCRVVVAFVPVRSPGFLSLPYSPKGMVDHPLPQRYLAETHYASCYPDSFAIDYCFCKFSAFSS